MPVRQEMLLLLGPCSSAPPAQQLCHGRRCAQRHNPVFASSHLLLYLLTQSKTLLYRRAAELIQSTVGKPEVLAGSRPREGTTQGNAWQNPAFVVAREKQSSVSISHVRDVDITGYEERKVP